MPVKTKDRLKLGLYIFIYIFIYVWYIYIYLYIFIFYRSGVCALQADVKLPGISLDVIKEAVEGGIQANHKILDIMSACIQEPR